MTMHHLIRTNGRMPNGPHSVCRRLCQCGFDVRRSLGRAHSQWHTRSTGAAIARLLRSTAAILVVGTACVAVAREGTAQTRKGSSPTQQQPPAQPENSSLDEDLLKDLGPDPVADEAGPSPAVGRRNSAAAGKAADGDTLDEELLKGLGDGEDLGASGEQDPLARLSQRMREVEALMARKRADGETGRLQSQIVHDIEELIKQARKQRQSSSSSSSGGKSGKGAQQTANRRDVSQPGRESTRSQQEAEAAARQSVKEARQGQARRPDMANMRELLKGVWGQLPARQREQMLQSYEEQFLPKYEQMIADYFRSLAEEQPRKP